MLTDDDVVELEAASRHRSRRALRDRAPRRPARRHPGAARRRRADPSVGSPGDQRPSRSSTAPCGSRPAGGARGAYDAELGRRLADRRRRQRRAAAGDVGQRAAARPSPDVPAVTATRSRSAPTTSSASRPGPAVVRTEVLRTGRSMSTGDGVPRAGRRRRPRGRADPGAGDVRRPRRRCPTTYAPPRRRRTSRRPTACVSAARRAAALHGAGRPAGAARPAAGPGVRRLGGRQAVGRRAASRAGCGWPTSREPDPLLLLLAVDALPPVTFDLGMLGWTPTLELTVHVRARPAPGWLRVAASTGNVAGGFLEEDAEVWDSAGRLRLQSRQLARAPADLPGRDWPR